MLRSHAAPLAVFCALAAFFCAPVLGDPTGLALGHPANDVWNHVWGYWWVADALSHGQLPLRTELLAWPRGGSLWFIDTFGALLTLPIAWLAGPVAAYNSSIFLNFVLCGLGAYALAWEAARTRAGATLAGVAFMSCPHLLGQAYNGISETLAAGWLPLALAALLRARRTGAGWVLAGVLLGINAFANWYYALFSALVGAAWLGVDLWRVSPLGGAGASQARAVGVLRGWLLTFVAAALVAAGPFSLFYLSMGADDAVVTRDPAFVWMTLVMHNMTDVESLFRPGHVYSPDLKAMFDEDLLVIVYLGHALVWPALATLATGWGRFTRPWALFAAGFLLLTLGPFLYIGGAYASLDGEWIPLPFLALFDAFPLFSRISHAYRFVVGASLGLSVMLAWAVKALSERGFHPALAAVWLGAMRLIEALWLSPAVFPLPTSETTIPAAYAAITEPGAVLDLPVSVPVLARSRYGLYQLAHRQPIPYGLNDPSPLYLYLNRYTRYLIELERSTVAFLPGTLPDLDLALAQDEITARGLGWIVVHRSEYPPAQVPKVLKFLDLTAVPTYDDGDVRVYRLPPIEGGT